MRDRDMPPLGPELENVDRALRDFAAGVRAPEMPGLADAVVRSMGLDQRSKWHPLRLLSPGIGSMASWVLAVAVTVGGGATAIAVVASVTDAPGSPGASPVGGPPGAAGASPSRLTPSGEDATEPSAEVDASPDPGATAPTDSGREPEDEPDPTDEAGTPVGPGDEAPADEGLRGSGDDSPPAEGE